MALRRSLTDDLIRLDRVANSTLREAPARDRATQNFAATTVLLDRGYLPISCALDWAIQTQQTTSTTQFGAKSNVTNEGVSPWSTSTCHPSKSRYGPDTVT